MSFAIGPGLAKRLQQYQDEPASDEVYFKNAKGQTQWSEAMGKSGRIYRHLAASNEVHVFDPASSIVSGGGPDPVPMPTIVQVPSPNNWLTRQGQDAIAIVIHTMSGTLAGADAWFKDPASEVSAHYGVGLGEGRVHQYVSLASAAWANGQIEPGNVWPGPPDVNPNLLTVSIETEDNNNPGQPVTEAQYNATLGCCRLALARFPSITYLLGHDRISPQTRSNCPGKRWRASGAMASLAKTLGLEQR